MKTPVVMYQGDEDRNVPPGSAWVTYRGLEKYSRAPAELFIFAGAAHDPATAGQLQRKMVEDRKWFDRYFWKDSGTK